ncbi:MAG: pentapeptide repeat-containing protein [Alphaproteobacteria bacterium]|nr:pentapeptide repeat-containing protein [Alphaproteobacteria bacterium]
MDLRADCSRCVGLCCVASTFSRGGDFALDKPAGQPCPNLDPDMRCGIHAELRAKGFPGCVSFDCFGAGQHVTQALFAGEGWRGEPARGRRMFAAFGQLRPVFGMRWHVQEALARAPEAQRAALKAAAQRLEQIMAMRPEALESLDLSEIGRHVDKLLQGLSRALRQGQGEDMAGAMLIEARLAGRSLRRADLRAALLLGADLRGADLREADLRGADLRVARLEGADLRGALFLTPMQLAAARGDARTRLPEGRARPDHWT